MIVGINLIALFDQKGTGAFRYIQLILHQLGKYNLKNCKLIVYKQKQISEEYLNIPQSLNVEFVNVLNVGRGLKRVFFEQTLFYYYLKKCDVFYSYCTSMPLFVRAKRIFTLHDVYYLTFKDRYPFFQRKYLEYVTRVYCHFADSILTVSEFSKSEILEHLHVDSAKVFITTNFVIPVTKITFKASDICDFRGNIIDLSVPFFLFVGNLQLGKNIKGMVEGFSHFVHDNPQVNLLIVGKITNCSAEMISIIEKTSNVYYLGYQSREHVEFLFSRCLAVVLLSFIEGFGIPPLEGFSYGKPALASNACSLPEVVGDAGVLVDPYNITSISNGYKELISNNNKYASKTQSQLEKYSPNKSMETFLKVLGIDYE